MSILLMSQVWTYELDHPEQSVLLALADHADDYGGSIFPSVGHTAWKTGYSKRQVQRIMADLRSRGVLIEVRAAYAGRAVEYRLDLERLARKAPYEPDKLTEDRRAELMVPLLVEGAHCRHCQRQGTVDHDPDGGAWHLDRIIPGARGGRYTPENITLSCGRCNRSLGAKVRDDKTAPPKKGASSLRRYWDARERAGDVTGHMRDDTAMAPKPSPEPSLKSSEIPPGWGYCAACRVLVDAHGTGHARGCRLSVSKTSTTAPPAERMAHGLAAA